MYPCKLPDAQCPRYSSFEPSQYVLELNAGLSERLGIEIGDEVIFQ
ncbi:DUF192 domain-containing protein [Candidatus Peregrinibacteria bacterium]|nr:DUF192 domain-containing protein [Candidatus Peregrinibacteria bacterium]